MNDLENILEEIYRKNKKDGICKIYMMNEYNSEFEPVEFEDFQEFYGSLVSARIVKYDSELIEIEEE